MVLLYWLSFRVHCHYTINKISHTLLSTFFLAVYPTVMSNQQGCPGMMGSQILPQTQQGIVGPYPSVSSYQVLIQFFFFFFFFLNKLQEKSFWIIKCMYMCFFSCKKGTTATTTVLSCNAGVRTRWADTVFGAPCWSSSILQLYGPFFPSTTQYDGSLLPVK